MHIVMNCGKSGKYFALTEGALCAGAHHAYGWGDTPEEALSGLFADLSRRVREHFSYVGRQAYIWYPGELPGD